MYGTDVERLISTISGIADSARSAVVYLSLSGAYLMITVPHVHTVNHNTQTGNPAGSASGGHSHDLGGPGNHSHPIYYTNITEESDTIEKMYPLSVSQYIGNISGLLNTLTADNATMQKMAGKLYTSTKRFNNSYGSPWTEISNLVGVINSLLSFNSAYGSLESVAAKASMLGLLNIVHSSCIDAKHAVISYHDYTQRGFNNISGKTDEMWTSFEDGETDGNVKLNNIKK